MFVYVLCCLSVRLSVWDSTKRIVMETLFSWILNRDLYKLSGSKSKCLSKFPFYRLNQWLWNFGFRNNDLNLIWLYIYNTILLNIYICIYLMAIYYTTVVFWRACSPVFTLLVWNSQNIGIFSEKLLMINVVKKIFKVGKFIFYSG